MATRAFGSPRFGQRGRENGPAGKGDGGKGETGLRYANATDFISEDKAREGEGETTRGGLAVEYTRHFFHAYCRTYVTMKVLRTKKETDSRAAGADS